jgi:putative phosphoesterase
VNLAIISDIHGNAWALDQVLARIDRERIDHVVCLGDVALMGFDPGGSIRRLIDRGIPTVRGNTEGRILENNPYQPDDPDEAQRERDWLAWTIDQIGTVERAFLEQLPGTIDLEIDGVSLTAYHGSPRDYYDSVLPDTPDAVLDAWFTETIASVLLGGHTHQQMLRRWNGRSIINPGTISLTAEKFPSGHHQARPWAEFAVMTLEAGSFDVSFRYVPIDLDELARHARASDMPHIDAWLALWHHDS